MHIFLFMINLEIVVIREILIFVDNVMEMVLYVVTMKLMDFSANKSFVK